MKKNEKEIMKGKLRDKRMSRSNIHLIGVSKKIIEDTREM